MVTYVFLVAAAMAIVFALVAIMHRSPVVNVLALIMVFFALAVIYAVLGMDFLAARQLAPGFGEVLEGAEQGTAIPLGEALLTTHVFAFELISVVLMAALIGAWVLARKEDR